MMTAMVAFKVVRAESDATWLGHRCVRTAAAVQQRVAAAVVVAATVAAGGRPHDAHAAALGQQVHDRGERD